MTRLLAIDTSTDKMHIGLRVHERDWLGEHEGGAGTSATLVSRLMTLLRDAGVALADLDAIAFGRGPGAFTGLRAGCAVAQGLALGAARPVIAVDSLMATAEEARLLTGAGDVWAAVDARMGEIYAAQFRREGNAWHTVHAAALSSPAALVAAWSKQPPSTVAGNATRVFEELACHENASIVPQARPTARALLACAQANIGRGALADPEAAQPLYVRDRVALTMQERAGHAASGAHSP